MTSPLAGGIIYADNESVQIYESVASANLALTSTVTDITGTSMTVTALTDDCKWVAMASVHIQRSASASNAFAVCTLSVNGTTQQGEMTCRLNTAIAFDTTLMRAYKGTLTAGTHTFKLRGSCPTSSIWTAIGSVPDTNLVVVVYR